MIKQYITNRELTIKYRGQDAFPKWEGIDVTIPKGHPVKRLAHGTKGWWYCAEQPAKLIDGKTWGTLLHDATYYGISIPADAVDEKPERKMGYEDH